MLHIVAQYADVWNMVGTPEDVRQHGEVLREACAAVGRDPATIRWSVAAWPGRIGYDPLASPQVYRDLVERYRAVGVSEVLCLWGPQTDLDTVERIAAEAAALRSVAG